MTYSDILGILKRILKQEREREFCEIFSFDVLISWITLLYRRRRQKFYTGRAQAVGNPLERTWILSVRARQNPARSSELDVRSSKRASMRLRSSGPSLARSGLGPGPVSFLGANWGPVVKFWALFEYENFLMTREPLGIEISSPNHFALLKLMEKV